MALAPRYNPDKFRYIHQNGWTANASRLVCQYLGFQGAYATVNGSLYGESSHDAYAKVGVVSCPTNATNITDCWIGEETNYDVDATIGIACCSASPSMSPGSPLGLESGAIPDSSITASSYAHSEAYPRFARLNGPHRWCSSQLNTDQWLQVQFESNYLVSGIVTQGRGAAFDRYVTSYKISSSIDNMVWTEYMDPFTGSVKVFPANYDMTSEVRHYFRRAITASSIRLHPNTYYVCICLRLELIGSRLRQRRWKVLSLFSWPAYVAQDSEPHSRVLRTQAWRLKSPLRLTRSKAFVRSVKAMYSGFCCSRHLSCSWRSEKIMSSVDRPALKPHCDSGYTRERAVRGVQTLPGTTQFFDPALQRWTLPSLVLAAALGRYSTLPLDLFPKERMNQYNLAPAQLQELPEADIDNHSELCPLDRGLPLGVGDGRIPDSSMSSSSWINIHHQAQYGRLDKQPNSGGYSASWVPREDDQDKWIKIDLGEVFMVTGVITQGRANHGRWVTSIHISTSLNDIDWIFAIDPLSNGPKVYPANYDRNTHVTSLLPNPLRARYVRIHPITFMNYVSMRVEVLGRVI
ncbi:EGF-like repeat and discoidin I-like domain-containing protein 3 [Diadema antillarum]|uniref:EGF-like repeat and discoidin I-like domain-containing protein 3 n=1 Tax=Diadema antillarum TaxID=105358 RepID=UPI003A8B2B32